MSTAGHRDRGRGGCLLRFAERLRAETELSVQLVDEPLTCVAIGAGRSLEDFEAVAKAGRPASEADRGGMLS